MLSDSDGCRKMQKRLSLPNGVNVQGFWTSHTQSSRDFDLLRSRQCVDGLRLPGRNSNDSRIGSKRVEPGIIRCSCGVDKGKPDTVLCTLIEAVIWLVIGNITACQGTVHRNDVDCTDLRRPLRGIAYSLIW